MTKAALSAETPVETIESVVAALFSGAMLKVPVRFELAEGETEQRSRIVNIRRAKMKELSLCIALMRAILERIPHDKFEDIVRVIADVQRGAILMGKSPQDITLTPEYLIEKWTKDGALILDVMQGAVDILPDFVHIFTDLTKSEFEVLEFDDATLLMIGIVGANYAFFTQRLLPIIRAAIGAWRRKRIG